MATPIRTPIVKLICGFAVAVLTLDTAMSGNDKTVARPTDLNAQPVRGYTTDLFVSPVRIAHIFQSSAFVKVRDAHPTRLIPKYHLI